MVAPASSTPSVEWRPGAGPEAGSIRLRGAWTLRNVAAARSRPARQIARHAAARRNAAWDLTRVEAIDSACALIVWRAWGRKRPADLRLRPEHADRFEALDDREGTRPGPRRDAPLDRIVGGLASLGLRLTGAGRYLIRLIESLGRIALDACAILGRREPAPWREFSATVARAGARALGILGLVGFLIGVTLAYLSAGQLRELGVEDLIVNLIGIGIFRELGPLLAGILLAGRSGSAITAEFAGMRLTEEIDALSVLGISVTARLVLPRTAAMMLIAPLAALWVGLLGLLGGMIVTTVEIGMPPREFLARVRDTLPPADVVVGLVKALCFGAAIAIVACHHGLRARPDTRSLGDETTRTVVVGLTLIIALDALLAVFFQGVGSG